MSDAKAKRRRRTVRRLIWLALAGVAGYVVYRVVSGLRPPQSEVPPRLLDAVGDRGDVTVTETITAAVATDGTVIVDDVTVAVDDRGAVVATDETIAVEAPDGSVVIDEVVSVADDQGDVVAVFEEASIETSNGATDAG